VPERGGVTLVVRARKLLGVPPHEVRGGAWIRIVDVPRDHVRVEVRFRVAKHLQVGFRGPVTELHPARDGQDVPPIGARLVVGELSTVIDRRL
jgi:hypothetical protein